tara:strand:+ start:1818 stop:2129 length:312 start_codon:yes stop_codon:yes gene_type:complete
MSEFNFAHGTDVGYWYHLCRCRPCTDAHAAYGYHRKSIRGKLGVAGPKLPTAPRHGTRNYRIRHSCSCELCRIAERDYRRSYRREVKAMKERRAAKQKSAPPA